MQIYRFGDFELDLDEFVLQRGGQRVKLERRPLDLLALLVKRPGHLVSREEIVAALWPANVIIDFDSGLNTLVRKVRNALGDSPETPVFIETVPGRGYRFAAPVEIAGAPDAATRSSPARRWRKPQTVALLSLLLVLLAALIARYVTDAEQLPQRIAFLPIENLTGNDVLADLASGLAWETRESLDLIDPEKLHVVEVPGREDIDPALVDLAVPCSLRLDQSILVLSCRLIKVPDGEQIWADSFPRELTNVLGLTRELSITIAEQIRLKISPEVAAEIDRRQTQSPEAYRLYLEGRGLWERLTPRSTLLAIESFRRATEQDPDYELAWAGLAFAAITSIRTADADPRIMKPLARLALNRTQQLGSTLAESWYAQGYYSLFGDLNAAAAAQAAQQAIVRDPNNPQALMLLGVSLQEFADPDAPAIMRQARVFGPNFALVFANSANVALARGELDEALELARHAVAISEEFWLGHFYVGLALQAQGDFAGALEEFAEAARHSEYHSLIYVARVSLLVRLDRIDEARTLLEEMNVRAADPARYVPPYALGVVNAMLGESDAAFGWLNAAIDDRDVNLPGLATDLRLQSLRADQRWADLLARCDCTEDGTDSRR